MKLGYIRMSDPIRDLCDQLELADSLGLDQVYLPSQAPEKLNELLGFPTKNLRIALDASAFGPLAPSQMDHAVRDMDHRLGGRLRLAVDVSFDGMSTKNRTDDQKFETLFSPLPFQEDEHLQSRYPMKPPCPKVIGILMTGSSDEASLAASRGYLPMTPSWLAPGEVARHWPAIVGGATTTLRRADPSHWQLARSIVIHNDPAKIEDYVFGPNSPIRKYYTQLAMRGVISADIDLHLRRVVISGTVEQVAQSLLELNETVGDLGMLNMLDHPGSDRTVSRHTMVCLAEEVMPIINKTSANLIKELERI